MGNPSSKPEVEIGDHNEHDTDNRVPGEQTGLLSKNSANTEDFNPPTRTPVLHDTVSSDEHVMKLERQNRMRLCQILITFCTCCILLGAVAVAYAYLQTQQRFERKLNTVSIKALQRLNKHVHDQQSIIAKGCESTLVLMRHCEKHGPTVVDDDGNEHCSYLGAQRADFLATLFGPTVEERWPTPAHLFGLTPTRKRRWNFREWETLQPLSKRSGVAIDVVNHNHDLVDQYFALLQSGSLCGQVTVVSWKHDTIPDLAAQLGCGPDNGCPSIYPEDAFDECWQLKYVFHPSRERTKHTIEDETKQDWPVNDGVDETNNSTATRALGQLKEKGQSKHGWNIYATKVNAGFDPLRFSKQQGIYNNPVAATTTTSGQRREL